MQEPLSFRSEILSKLKDLVIDQLSSEKVCVYLFGSWAREEEKKSSDIDIAIEPKKALDPIIWNKLLEEIEESIIPYKVDVIDVRYANPELVKKVKEEGVLWKNCITD
ncbi:nucleotidyltransferase family protein [Salibacterium aidingense]|uniref:nucleotidyltransferase family protein n=1 Tax=Salibacterium aidingense TaxID=384933 RepID=UPI000429F9EF|nr:nucleotidyltransferase domain-containing protein [Salibacterium aidingense]